MDVFILPFLKWEMTLLMNGLRCSTTQNTPRVVSAFFCPSDCNGGCCSQSPSKVNCSNALCQVTTDEVDAATKLLDKACQKLRGIPDVPSQRITDLEAAIRQMRQLSCIWDSCTISASYEVSQAQKAILLMPRTAKGAKHVICTDFTTHWWT